MTLPNPLLVWSLALGALALGLRSRRGTRRCQGPELPFAIRAAGALPVPRSLSDRVISASTLAALTAAGIRGPGAPMTVARARLGMAEAGLAIGAVIAIAHPIGILVGVLLGVGGLLGPRRWASLRARRRRAQIVRELPDLIDLVVICTQAGMALEPALRIAGERLVGPLRDEVGQTLRELDLGTPRREAYSALSTRMSVPELTGLVGELLQAEELGAPIADVLTRQAELLRSARRQDVREHAARAAPKVQLVVALVMVPAALLVILGVLVIQLVGQIGGVVGGAT